MDVIAQHCVDAACEFAHHVGLRYHYEGNGGVRIGIDCCVVDLDLEIRNFLQVEDVIGWKFEYHLPALIDGLLLCLDVPQNQTTEVTLERSPGGSPVDHHGGVEHLEAVLQMLRFLDLGLGYNQEAVNLRAGAEAVEQGLAEAKGGEEGQ